jgi:hypothetical protein
MLHASGGTRFTMKALLRSFITDEPLAEDFDRDLSLDEQMRRAIDRAHAAAAEAFIQPILPIKDAAD